MLPGTQPGGEFPDQQDDGDHQGNGGDVGGGEEGELRGVALTPEIEQKFFHMHGSLLSNFGRWTYDIIIINWVQALEYKNPAGAGMWLYKNEKSPPGIFGGDDGHVGSRSVIKDVFSCIVLAKHRISLIGI